MINTATAVVAAVFASGLIAATRWLRVTQREHYEPGRAMTIARLWLAVAPAARAHAATVALVGLCSIVAAIANALPAAIAMLLATGAGAASWPTGLPWRGRDRSLVWTARLQRLALTYVGVLALTSALLAVIVSVLPMLGIGLAVLATLAVPLVVDACALLMRPVEMALAKKYVVSAQEKLRRLAPIVVAITGSYGKTSTKNYLAHIVGGVRSTVATPGSFNNLLGLSRSINERLVQGTEVFIAEMGTYGVGEISRLCEYFPPDIAAITAIGDVHLERMGSRKVIAQAKAEIISRARTVVLNADAPELAAVASDARAAGQAVVEFSTDASRVAEHVVVAAHEGGMTQIFVRGKPFTKLQGHSDAHPGNVACAVALAIALDVPDTVLARQLLSLPSVPHRAEASMAATGYTIIDDTYNSNPDGASAALKRARNVATEKEGTVWVITPGMVEMGEQQTAANRRFAQDVLESGSRLVIVGHVNRGALLEGARRGIVNQSSSQDPGPFNTRVQLANHREAAGALIVNEARPGDTVLYENDIPDHYP